MISRNFFSVDSYIGDAGHNVPPFLNPRRTGANRYGAGRLGGVLTRGVYFEDQGSSMAHKGFVR